MLSLLLGRREKQGLESAVMFFPWFLALSFYNLQSSLAFLPCVLPDSSPYSFPSPCAPILHQQTAPPVIQLRILSHSRPHTCPSTLSSARCSRVADAHWSSACLLSRSCHPPSIYVLVSVPVPGIEALPKPWRPGAAVGHKLEDHVQQCFVSWSSSMRAPAKTAPAQFMVDVDVFSGHLHLLRSSE